MSSTKDSAGKTNYHAEGSFNQPPPQTINIPIKTVAPAGRTGKAGPQPPKPSNAAPTRAPR
jgi:hypothetical protein